VESTTASAGCSRAAAACSAFESGDGSFRIADVRPADAPNGFKVGVWYYANGNRVIEVTPEGKTVWSIEHDELPGIKLSWVTSLKLLSNGHLVFGNCHAGPDNPQLIEVTRDKKVVWTFKDHDLVKSLTTVRVLDDR